MVSFQTKNPNLGKFWRAPWLENVDIFYGHLEYFTDIWDIIWPFGTFFPVWVIFAKKNLATLYARRKTSSRKICSPGIDFMWHNFGRKIFRTHFRPQILDKIYNQKQQMWKNYLTIIGNSRGLEGHLHMQAIEGGYNFYKKLYF
jgi:hypothetical protein